MAQTSASILAQAPHDMAVSIRRDIWIAHKLKRPDLYSMTTIPSVRMERQRREILRQGIEDTRISAHETWRAFFQRTHGEALESTGDN